MGETEHLMSVPENRDWLMESKNQLEKVRGMRTYTEAVQELACLERLRQQTEDAELASGLSLRIRGGAETLAFLFEVEQSEVREDIWMAAALDGLESGL